MLLAPKIEKPVLFEDTLKYDGIFRKLDVETQPTEGETDDLNDRDETFDLENENAVEDQVADDQIVGEDLIPALNRQRGMRYKTFDLDYCLG